MNGSDPNETAPADQPLWFAAPVARIAAPWQDALTRRLAGIGGLDPAERDLVREAGHTALLTSLHGRLSRLFLIELHALRLARGGAGSAQDTETWSAFIEEASQDGYLDRIAPRYPALRPRLESVARLSVAAVAAFASRLAADRSLLEEIVGAPPGALRGVTFGAGDTHRGGLTVSRADFDGGTVMYKPRRSQIDAALGALIDELYAGFTRVPDRGERIRVPRVLLRDGYGWAEFVRHRYCADERELAVFYRNIGHWLAVLRFVGGTDMHAENMVAAGPVPVIVDSETLFDAPPVVGGTAAATGQGPTAGREPAAFPPSGRGQAVDIAAAAIRRTVLRTGLLPVRGAGYALGGVDISGVGALPGQQPRIPSPVVTGGGTAAARLQVDLVEMPTAGNHPSPTPVLSAYWDRVLDGFREMTAHLRRRAGGTDEGGYELLRRFEGAEARRILRPTQAYVDIARMLWHPASLHDEAAAVERARSILRRNAEALPGAPREPATVDAEIADLLVGDVPMFTFEVDGPVIEATLADWRTADMPFEESIIKDALVGAYLNERSLPARVRHPAADPHSRDADARRRALAAAMVGRLCEGSVRGDDSTVTWISPVFTPAGWSIRVLPADLYTGQGGVALALAEYVTQVRAGRAEEVPGVEEHLRGALRVLADTEDTTPTPSAGAFSGAASQVWTWTALHRVLGWDWLLERAVDRATALDEGPLIDEDRDVDLLNGVAGVAVPLLNLAAATGQDRWLGTAARAGRRLVAQATLDPAGARWSTRLNPAGIGGFAHGATGIGWTLARLALSDAGSPAERRAWSGLASRAFAYQESLYRPEDGNWLDVRIGSEEDFFTSWCHGSAGIGIAMLDLYRRTGDPHHLDAGRRAARACAADGFGWSHTLCHGDLGTWEMLDAIRTADPTWDGPGRPRIDGELLTGLEQRGPVGGLAREAFSPSLMSGLAGVVHALLRMHPAGDLPSPLLLD
ncbi:type 2 lanthipeptide synthetase LanM family protein [Streptomyces sp.]|uniref:type 2 lanthipeptide synthetase LanM family protein n=1 Tax=Streptomyces sp. TaxID=1931 RepID=UPI002F422DDF